MHPYREHDYSHLKTIVMKVRYIALFSTLIFFNLSLSATTWGQTSLKGKVTDSMTGEAILFGSVTLYKNDVLITGTETDLDGNYFFSNLDPGTYDIEASYIGYTSSRVKGVIIKAGKSNEVNLSLSEGVAFDEIVIVGYEVPLIDFNDMSQGTIVRSERINNTSIKDMANTTVGKKRVSNKTSNSNVIKSQKQIVPKSRTPWNTKDYCEINENKFHLPNEQPLSTFSIDVDRAAYSNVRRYLNNGSLPPADAVRIEEMINYFDYEYAQPQDEKPFAVQSTLMPCPWNKKNQVLHMSIQGKKISDDNLPPSNIVFLVDVSGSMSYPNKLGLLKSSLKLLTQNLRAKDRVAMVVYASNAGLVLPSTAGSNKATILEALDKLQAGGSTAGGAGIQLAYKVAKDNFIADGNNRVILATDGDFNVGVSSDTELVKLIESKRDDGIFLSVLGYGMNNYRDNKMQELADNGNGNHAYIDNIQEARKVLINEFGGTLHTIAKDVKIQIEFNPLVVAGYRLIGYENRMLAKEDFNNDTKDAGELGAGHVVTAMYEIIPSGVESTYLSSVDPLKYQKEKSTPESTSDEMATIKLRYKKPNGSVSKKIQLTVKNILSKNVSRDVGFAMCVAEFGQLLRNSKYKSASSYDRVIQNSKEYKGEDEFGYRSEFISLVQNARDLDNRDLVRN